MDPEYSKNLKKRADTCDAFISPSVCEHTLGQAEEVLCPEIYELCCAWCLEAGTCECLCPELSFVEVNNDVITFDIKPV